MQRTHGLPSQVGRRVRRVGAHGGVPLGGRRAAAGGPGNSIVGTVDAWLTSGAGFVLGGPVCAACSGAPILRWFGRDLATYFCDTWYNGQSSRSYSEWDTRR